MYGDLDFFIGSELLDFEIPGHFNYIVLSIDGQEGFPLLGKLIGSNARSADYAGQELLQLIDELCALGIKHSDNSEANRLVLGFIKTINTAIQQSAVLTLSWD